MKSTHSSERDLQVCPLGNAIETIKIFRSTMSHLHPTLETPSVARGKPLYRFRTVMDLVDGGALGSLCDMSTAFDERVTFSPPNAPSEIACPATWLADRLVDIACAAHGGDPRHRPIIVPAPISALRHVHAPLACDTAVRRTTLCQQEFSLEFQDAAFATNETVDLRFPISFRRRGFRVSLDMRKSWQTKMTDSFRLLIDTIRIDARMLDSEPELLRHCEAASEAGILVIAENAKWRQGPGLANLGIRAAVSPKTDS